MSLFTKLLMAVIIVGCAICIGNLLDFAGLVFKIFVIFFVAKALAGAFGSKETPVRSSNKSSS